MLAAGIVKSYDSNLAETNVPGLFSDDYYWWEAGAVLNSLMQYSYLTGDAQYNTRVSKAIQWQLADENAFMPANQTSTSTTNAQSIWALAAMTAVDIALPKLDNAE